MYSSPAMSRPATPREMSSSMENPNNSQGSQGRLMQVKVLYTFDDNNKSNCLARCAQPLYIKTAHLDPSSEIGIIELRTCVQAIVAASPELIAKLGHDYTVYAYDYSEYETPLVGQGMLSWVLASASTTPMAPAQQSRTMVTGRVCKNILGLFSDGVKETLEVKLRLVPVPTCLQSEYLANMEKYRDASSLASQGIDADAWRTFLRSNPGFDVDGTGSNEFSPSDNSFNTFAYPPMGAFQANSPAPTSTPNMGAFNPTSSQPLQSNRTISAPNTMSVEVAPLATSRPTTPSGQARVKQSAPSRPSSRASNRGGQAARPRGSSRATSFQGQEPSVTEEGLNRKRARTVKADWSGPATFGTTTDSLRVTASVAASIRSHDITRPHPTASELAAGEFGTRPPTPRPVPPLRRKPSEIRPPTSLSHEAIPPRSDEYVSPYPSNFYESVLTSPEGPNSSVDSTPQNMPSSPPVPRMRSVTPSSPALPVYADQHDSGFMSGPPDDCSGDEEDELKIASNQQNISHALRSELSITTETPGDPSLLPHKLLPRTVPAKRRASTVSNRNVRAKAAQASSPKVPCLPFPNSSICLPSETNEPNEDTEQRETSVVNPDDLPTTTYSRRPNLERSDSCMSDSMLPSDISNINPEGKSNTTKRNAGSSMKRKKAIQERLVNSIAAGQMPPFCRNCGEISTPTWRKAFVKIEDGSPDSLQLSDNDEGIITYEPVAKDDDGTVTSYRIIKKMISTEETGFEEVQLCNPCGIWLFKWRNMRPPEQWTKVANTEAPKRRRPSRKASRPTLTEAQSEAQSEMDQLHLLHSNDDPGSAGRSQPSGNFTEQQHHENQSQSPDKANHAGNVAEVRPTNQARQMGNGAAVAALQKAFQSSPPRFPGSKHRPIDLDADGSPQPVRRLLFPSPRRPGEVKVLEALTLEGDHTKTGHADIEPSANSYGNEDKENLPPTADEDEERLDRLFEDSDNSHGSPHTPKRHTETPTALKTPIRSAKKQALMPNEYLSPTTRTADLRTTPNRGSITGVVVEEMTPFTAQLTQLISEANFSATAAGTMADVDFSAALGGGTDMFNFADFGAAGMADAFGTTPPESSPAMFALYEDPLEGTNASWDARFLGGEIGGFLDPPTGQEEGEVVDQAGGSGE